ncbi:MAG: hypothetical protein JNG88_00310, partial [Phycisphaerales bacterium]|nr:hypothetical protein [Phycisphaerales bacterium]
VCQWIMISAALSLAAPALAQPANDNCTSPQAQSDIITFVASSAGATNDGAATCGGTNDIWFNYQASVTGTVAIDTCGSDFDTTLAAFDSCGGTELACDDDSGCGNTSLIQFAVTGGQTYRLRVAGKSGATGNVVITASVVPTGGSRPANDACENAEVVNNGTTTGTNVASTTDATAACVTSVASGKDVWYKYTAPANGSATFDTRASDQLGGAAITDTVLSVLNACEGTEIACNDDADAGTLYSSVTITVVSGTTYRIRVAGSLGQSGQFILTVNGPTAPTNGNDNSGGNSNDNSSGNDNENSNSADNTNSGTDSNTNSGGDSNSNTGGSNQNTGDGTGNGADNSDGNVDDPNAAANQCAAGVCGGANALSLIPLTLLGIACMKAGVRPARRRSR